AHVITHGGIDDCACGDAVGGAVLSQKVTGLYRHPSVQAGSGSLQRRAPRGRPLVGGTRAESEGASDAAAAPPSRAPLTPPAPPAACSCTGGGEPALRAPVTESSAVEVASGVLGDAGAGFECEPVLVGVAVTRPQSLGPWKRSSRACSSGVFGANKASRSRNR